MAAWSSPEADRRAGGRAAALPADGSIQADGLRAGLEKPRIVPGHYASMTSHFFGAQAPAPAYEPPRPPAAAGYAGGRPVARHKQLGSAAITSRAPPLATPPPEAALGGGLETSAGRAESVPTRANNSA